MPTPQAKPAPKPAMAAAAPIPEESQPAASGNILNRDNPNVINDPNKGKSGFINYAPPREE